MTQTIQLSPEPTHARSNRDRLIIEARRLFSQKGFASVSVDEIAAAAAAGLTKGAVYYQFKDKTDLFLEACRAVMDDVVRHVETAGRNSGTPRLEELITGGRRLFDAYDTLEARQMLLIDGLSVLGFERWMALQEPAGSCLVADALKHYAQAGLLPAERVEPLSNLLFGAFIQAVLRITSSPNRNETAREVRMASETLLDGFFRGLKGHRPE